VSERYLEIPNKKVPETNTSNISGA